MKTAYRQDLTTTGICLLAIPQPGDFLCHDHEKSSNCTRLFLRRPSAITLCMTHSIIFHVRQNLESMRSSRCFNTTIVPHTERYGFASSECMPILPVLYCVLSRDPVYIHVLCWLCKSSEPNIVLFTTLPLDKVCPVISPRTDKRADIAQSCSRIPAAKGNYPLNTTNCKGKRGVICRSKVKKCGNLTFIRTI